jgi:hypothetical protein
MLIISLKLVVVGIDLAEILLYETLSLPFQFMHELNRKW